MSCFLLLLFIANEQNKTEIVLAVSLFTLSNVAILKHQELNILL